MENKKRFAIVIGHTQLRQGACGINIPCEFKYNSKVSEFLCDIADTYYYDSYNFGYKSMVKRNATKLNREDYDLVLELHYNASAPQANGTEIFYFWNNREGKHYATQLSEMISKKFDTRNRGAKSMMLIEGQKAPRGYWAVALPKATTLLLEPFFGSNPKDSRNFKDKECEYAEIIREFLNSI